MRVDRERRRAGEHGRSSRPRPTGHGSSVCGMPISSVSPRLALVDIAVIAAKLGELADRIDRVTAHRPADAASLERDRDALDLVAFNLMLAGQACLDLARHPIAHAGRA